MVTPTHRASPRAAPLTSRRASHRQRRGRPRRDALGDAVAGTGEQSKFFVQADFDAQLAMRT